MRCTRRAEDVCSKIARGFELAHSRRKCQFCPEGSKELDRAVKQQASLNVQTWRFAGPCVAQGLVYCVNNRIDGRLEWRRAW